MSAPETPPLPDREQTIHALTQAPLDVLIIGGGIVGAGVARDAALRGLKVGLVEQHDFAFGTSSRSSRLLHGGLRYLAQGRVGLVYEASVEKGIIHRIAPHLAQPLPFLFPTYRGNREWKLWQLKIGVKIYDLLCHGRNLGRSTWLTGPELLQKVPGLERNGLTGAVRYFDGFTNDARLVLDTLRSAGRAGAHLLNYARFQNAAPGKGWTCSVHDGAGTASLTVQARTVVNATGSWAGGVPHSQVQLRLTKGIHLVVEQARLPVRETVVMTEGKRILFAIPWGERTVLGTTDTDYDGALDHVTAETAEIRYVLGIANAFFPSAQLTPADVISTWAGLRPLLADPRGNPSDLSRSHEIRSPEPDWWDVAGGKLTTYRLMAEQTVDRLLPSLRRGGSAPQIAPCRTAREPLLAETETFGCSGIVPPEFSEAVVAHACRREWALHLSDLMLRRTSWHYYLPDAAQRAETAAGWMGALLGWSAAARATELSQYRSAPAAPFSAEPGHS